MSQILKLINTAAKIKNGPLDDVDLKKLDAQLNHQMPWYDSLSQTDDETLFESMSECLKKQGKENLALDLPSCLRKSESTI
jgi:hypothetical protein